MSNDIGGLLVFDPRLLACRPPAAEQQASLYTMLLLDASPFLGGEERWKTIYKLPVDTLKEKKKKKKNKKLKSAAPLPFLFFFHVVVCRHIKK